MSKKSKYTPQSYESTGTKPGCKPGTRDVSGNIYMSMLLSRAWLDLSPQQKTLYVCCKAQQYAEHQDKLGKEIGYGVHFKGNLFTMNHEKWCNVYKLYADTNRAGFHRDMDALIAHGLIDCVRCGKIGRVRSIYAYSVRWHAYGTDEFDIPANICTTSLLRKLKSRVQTD
jgi:hypothetical protein